MNKIRKMFEGNYETKTPNKFANTKINIYSSICHRMPFLLTIIYSGIDLSKHYYLRAFPSCLISVP